MRQNEKIIDNRYFIKRIDVLLIIDNLKYKKKNVRNLTINTLNKSNQILSKFQIEFDKSLIRDGHYLYSKNANLQN